MNYKLLLVVVIASCIQSSTMGQENTGPSDQYQYFLSLVESIVDSRFKLLAAEFRDQVNNLKGKILRPESKKTYNDGVIENQHRHEIQRREISTASERPIQFQNVKSSCTFFYPDHPDANGKIGKNEAHKSETKSSKSTQSVCETSSSFCTFFYPDRLDADRKEGKYNPITTKDNADQNSDNKDDKKNQASNYINSNLPSSCEELNKLNHNSDGIHLVKNQETNKIQAVFCQFTSAPNKINQRLIGHLDVKTKSVHFYVQRKSRFVCNGTTVPFEVERLNVGEAMNLDSGVFTAPVSGIYHFEFSGIKASDVSTVVVTLQVNGVSFGMANVGMHSAGTYNRISLTASLRLKPNDKVSLYPYGGVLYDNNDNQNHFTGWLVEEDLI